MKNDTIAAIATPAGMGGVGVIRISGNEALNISQLITKKTLKPRYAHYANFYDKSNNVIDQGVVIYFNAPNSYTGEEVVEFQGHGGVNVLQSVLQLIVSYGARQAKPGEFTERAFLNDKIDLIQAEAVADLIESRSHSATSAALRSLTGEFSKVINDLQRDIISLRVYVEAALDFSEEEIDFLSDGNVETKIISLLCVIKETQQKAGYGQLLTEGVQVVLIGEPNAGKSSLLNQLLGQERAIVTSEAGTTRDTLQETLLVRGVPVTVTDTAGLREAKNVVEKVGIERAKAAVKSADLAIWLRDGRSLADSKPAELEGVNYIEVHNKLDLYKQEHHGYSDSNTLKISAKTGQGIDELIGAIAEEIIDTHNEEGVFSARERHVQALSLTHEHVNAAYSCIQSLATAELVAEELRLAQNALSEITGEYQTDDLLGDIFSSFCVGK